MLIILGVIVIFIVRPTQPKLWSGICIFGIGGVASIASWVSSRKKAKMIFDDRPSLSEVDIYRRYYSDTKLPQPLVIELWNEVAKTLHIPPGKLLPTDRFGHELSGYWITSDELDTLAEKANARARQYGVAIDFSEVKTLDEYIKQIGKLKTHENKLKR